MSAPTRARAIVIEGSQPLLVGPSWNIVRRSMLAPRRMTRAIARFKPLQAWHNSARSLDRRVTHKHGSLASGWDTYSHIGGNL
jgi:hypothetical protein